MGEWENGERGEGKKKMHSWALERRLGSSDEYLIPKENADESESINTRA
jgi:hypothetical protein